MGVGETIIALCFTVDRCNDDINDIVLVTQKILGDVQGAQPHNLSGGKGGALKSVQVR